MKQTILLLILFISSSVSYAQCENGGLEYNNFTNWSNYYGTYSGGNLNIGNLNAGTIPGRHTIVSSGMDPTLATFGVNMPMVVDGNYAFRLGNSSSGNEADNTRYSFTVDNNNQEFSFRYSMVFQDPEHPENKQPFFSYVMFIGTNFDWNSTIISEEQWVSDASDPFFESIGDIAYRDWSTKCIDLSPYLGQTVTIMFTAVDCSLGGHFGYAYIDGLCSENGAIPSFTVAEEYCPNQPVIVDGYASINEDSHFWSIQESLPNWTGIGPEYSQWYVGQEAGQFDFNAFMQQHEDALKCNTYYRVKLAVSNECTPWVSDTKLIYITCPDVTAGPDICCSGTAISTIGSLNNSLDNTYYWSPTIGVLNPNEGYSSLDCSLLNDLGQDQITYELTAIDELGCSTTDQVTVYFNTPTGEITQVSDCCSRSLNFSGENYTSFVWSTGQQNVETIHVEDAGTYWVTATNPCGSRSFIINVGDSFLNRYYADLGDENVHSFYSSTSNLNSQNAFNIWHVEDPEPLYGEYFATEYRLEIFNRWGDLIRVIEDEIDTCQGFDNPEIQWDGTVGGTQVQNGAYNGRLYLKNCQSLNWQEVKVNYCAQWDCLEWDCVFSPFFFECGFFKQTVCLEKYCSDERKELAFPIIVEF